MKIGSDRTPYSWFVKLFCRWDSSARLLRLGRLVWATGRNPGPGWYSAKLSLALTPRLFGFSTGFHEWAVTLLGLRVHFQKSFGGWIAAVIAALCLPAVASAGHCKQFFHHQQVVAVQAVPYVSYSVGDNIRLEALAEKVAAIVTQKLQAAPPALAQTAPQSILAQRCAKCHGPSDPKGGHVIDGVTAIDCNVFRRSMEMLAGKGEAPPAAMQAVIKQIQAEAKQGDIMDAMLSLPLAAPPAPGELE